MLRDVRLMDRYPTGDYQRRGPNQAALPCRKYLKGTE